MSKSRVLFLCTGNSCRSQMAEALVKQYLRKEWKAFSAGVQPADRVHPLAVKAMAEIGIDISKNKPKPASSFRDKKLDLVVTVCDSAAEQCPVWLGRERSVHISFPDPAEAEGTEAEKMQVFRAVRDDIRRRVLYYLANGRVLAQGYLTDAITMDL